MDQELQMDILGIYRVISAWPGMTEKGRSCAVMTEAYYYGSFKDV